MVEVLTLAWVLAAVEPLRIAVDPATSEVSFTLAATLHTVKGTFRVKGGSIRLNGETGEVQGRLVVDAASGETGNEKRDAKMKGSVLETERFPDIVFSPEKLEGALSGEGEAQVQVRGTLLIHGQSHALTMPMTVGRRGRKVVARGTFTVPYVEWGMKNPGTALLHTADKVDVAVHLTGTIE